MRSRGRLPASAGRSRGALWGAALVAVLAAACAAPAPPAARPLPRPAAPTKPPPAPAARPAPPAPKPAAPRPVILPSAAPWYVTVPSVNLRRCPAVECSRLAVLTQNEVLLRLQEEGEWVEVRVVRTGETGWVAGRFLVDRPVAVPPKPRAPAQTAPARPAPGGAIKEEFLE